MAQPDLTSTLNKIIPYRGEDGVMYDSPEKALRTFGITEQGHTYWEMINPLGNPHPYYVLLSFTHYSFEEIQRPT